MLVSENISMRRNMFTWSRKVHADFTKKECFFGQHQFFLLKWDRGALRPLQFFACDKYSALQWSWWQVQVECANRFDKLFDSKNNILRHASLSKLSLQATSPKLYEFSYLRSFSSVFKWVMNSLMNLMTSKRHPCVVIQNSTARLSLFEIHLTKGTSEILRSFFFAEQLSPVMHITSLNSGLYTASDSTRNSKGWSAQRLPSLKKCTGNKHIMICAIFYVCAKFGDVMYMVFGPSFKHRTSDFGKLGSNYTLHVQGQQKYILSQFLEEIWEPVKRFSVSELSYSIKILFCLFAHWITLKLSRFFIRL